MHAVGKFVRAQFEIDGNLNVTFSMEDKAEALHGLEKLKGENRLTIDIRKFREKRSLDANSYFWKLCTEIARVIDSDKDSVYILQLSKYGVWIDVSVENAALEMLTKVYRYTEVLHDMFVSGKPGKKVRCYAGSSVYDTKEMSDLINGTVNDAKALGIDTLTPEEQRLMLLAWENANNSKQTVVRAF